MEILTVGDKTLRKKAKRVSNVDDTIRNLCASLVKTMYENNGVGLAAPQVGILKRIIVVDITGKPLILINPEISFMSDDRIKMDEGCLSVPGNFKEIDRPRTIVVRYRDTKGRYNLEKYDGLTSRIIQHEVDHLDGVLMIDHASQN
jgi:peptide deformylase